jgi:hypothetical protein
MGGDIRKMIDKVKNFKHFVNERLELGSQERIHLSKTPIDKIENGVKNQDVHGKPGGLWYGFGDNWINFKKYGVTWDTKENVPLKGVMNSEVYIYKLYLDMSEIMILNTEDLFKEFTEKYSTHQNYPHNINWDLVSKKYKGIEFPNYEEIGVRNLHQESKEYYWAYTIDANSGCIWDVSAIKKFRLL